MFVTCAVTIKVPWGYIAGKAWGYSKGHPVLALHGKLLWAFWFVTGLTKYYYHTVYIFVWYYVNLLLPER